MRDSWHFPALCQTANRLRRSFPPIKKRGHNEHCIQRALLGNISLICVTIAREEEGEMFVL